MWPWWWLWWWCRWGTEGIVGFAANTPASFGIPEHHVSEFYYLLLQDWTLASLLACLSQPDICYSSMEMSSKHNLLCSTSPAEKKWEVNASHLDCIECTKSWDIWWYCIWESCIISIFNILCAVLGVGWKRKELCFWALIPPWREILCC